MFLSFHACYVDSLVHPLSVSHYNQIWCSFRIMELLIRELSPVSSYCSILGLSTVVSSLLNSSQSVSSHTRKQIEIYFIKIMLLFAVAPHETH